MRRNRGRLGPRGSWVLLAMLILLPACLRSAVSRPSNLFSFRTTDGWELSLRHMSASGPPVLFVPGLERMVQGTDPTRSGSLAAYLHDQGWDVWILNLRSTPQTRAPTHSRRVRFDDIASLDVPSAIRTVQALSGRQKLVWVGHSIGGMLLYSSLTQSPQQILAGVALSSPACFPSPSPRSFPDGLFPARWAPRHDLARWNQAGALLDERGQPWLTNARVPVLVLGGEKDPLTNADQASCACDVLEDCRYLELAGHDHLDILLGPEAERDVFPLVAKFLAEQRDR